MIRRLATRYGVMFVPDTDVAQYPWLAEAGAAPDDDDIDAVIGLLGERPPGDVIDVGACFGTWSLALAPHAETVVAFEPQPAVFDVLSRNAAAPGNVAPLQMAIGLCGWGQVRIAKLNIDAPANFGGLALGETCVDQPAAPVIVVPIDGLDELLPSHRPVSFIKIDTEGAEASVLAGAARTIEKWRPILFIETDHPRTDKPALLSWLDAAGYAIDQRGPNALCIPTARGPLGEGQPR